MNPHSSASAINIYENTANGYALENRSEIVSGISIYIEIFRNFHIYQIPDADLPQNQYFLFF